MAFFLSFFAFFICNFLSYIFGYNRGCSYTKKKYLSEVKEVTDSLKSKVKEFNEGTDSLKSKIKEVRDSLKEERLNYLNKMIEWEDFQEKHEKNNRKCEDFEEKYGQDIRNHSTSENL